MTEATATPGPHGAAGSPPAPVNLADLARRAAGRDADRAALIEGSVTTTWSALDSAVDAVAAGLLARGLRPGDRVAIVLPTCAAFVQAYLGTLRSGCVAVPVSTHLTAGELARVLVNSGAGVVVTDVDTADTTRAAIGLMPDVAPEGTPDDQPPPDVVVVGGALQDGRASFDELLGTETGPVPAGSGGEDLAVLLYTSGTSGQPRAAMLTHRALLANLDQVLALDTPVMQPDDVVLAVLPMFHVYGLNAVLGMAARIGATLVLTSRFEPDAALDLVREHQVTVVPAAPPLLVAWSSRPDLAERLAPVRMIVSGAAALSVTLLEEIQTLTGKPVHEGYGLTEAAPVVSTTLVAPGTPLRAGSVGRPLPGIEVRLVDESGGEPEEGDPGEIVIRGANLFSGYWPDGSGGPDAEGWYRTGDVAFLAPDGNLTLVDRVRDLVIVSGFNVYPREVEDVIVEVPGVREAAVIPVPHPYTGEAVKAFVVTEPGSEVTVGDVLEHCRSRLARFKVPSIVSLVDELPHTPTGKIAKGHLRAGEARLVAGII